MEEGGFARAVSELVSTTEDHSKLVGVVFTCQLGKKETQYQETASCQLILRHYLTEGLFQGMKTGDVR